LIEEINAVLPPRLFRDLLREAPLHGNAQWTPRCVVWVSVLMFWISGHSLEERFSAARRLVKFMHPHWRLPASYAGFVAARERLGPLLWPAVRSALQPDESFGSAWRVLGWLVLAVDGSRFECPRTAANEAGLGCAGKQRTAPQVFQTTLLHVGTGLPWDVCLGPGTDSERRHLDAMLERLPPGTLLTADAGFISYQLCAALIEGGQAFGQAFVLRVGGNHTLLTDLGWEHDPQDGSIVYLWPEKEKERGRPPVVLRPVVLRPVVLRPVVLRAIRFRSRGGLPVVLVTNVTDRELLPDESVREIYAHRWGIEVYYRSLKQTMKLGVLQSRTPKAALAEQRWRLISFWLLQHMVVRGQLAAGKNVRRFSAARARREIREVLALMQQGRGGRSLVRRWQAACHDSYHRNGPKTTRPWPRQKNDQPPKPPKTRTAQPQEIRIAKELGFKHHLVS
jgi:hypothetical protein